MPRSTTLLRSLRADGVPAVVSGAGPTILAMVPPAAVPELLTRVPEGWRSLHLPPDLDGTRRLP
jgi:homoserine kinase